MPRDTLAVMHLAFLAFWGGVVAAESVLELTALRRPQSRETVIRLHFWIDVIIELPAIAAVTLSGACLLLQAWPPTLLHVIKLGCVAVPIVANLTCITLVIKRFRSMAAGAMPSGALGDTRRIVMTAVVGLPFALAGACVGLLLAARRMAQGLP